MAARDTTIARYDAARDMMTAAVAVAARNWSTAHNRFGTAGVCLPGLLSFSMSAGRARAMLTVISLPKTSFLRGTPKAQAEPNPT